MDDWKAYRDYQNGIRDMLRFSAPDELDESAELDRIDALDAVNSLMASFDAIA